MSLPSGAEFVEKDLWQTFFVVLVPACLTWIAAGFLFWIGWHVSAVVLLGLGLTVTGTLLAMRFQEQVMRLVLYNYELLQLARSNRSEDK